MTLLLTRSALALALLTSLATAGACTSDADEPSADTSEGAAGRGGALAEGAAGVAGRAEGGAGQGGVSEGAGGMAGAAAGTGGAGGTSGAGGTGGASGANDPGTEGDGDYTIGPDYQDAPESTVADGAPRGTVDMFTMESKDSKIYTGLDPSLTAPATFTRSLWVYTPANYVKGTELPFMVVQDGGGYKDRLAPVLDNLIHDKTVPAMAVVFINPGPGDGRGSERGLEYDTVSNAYLTFIETEVLPVVSTKYGLTLTKNPEGRASMGGSSGGAAAFTMGWFGPDLYHRIVTYSGTFVNQHPDANYPLGAWEYHQHLIAESPAKPLRVFLECGEHDNNLNAADNDTYHDWVEANKAMAAVLKAKGYHDRFLYALNAGHVDPKVLGQTLPDTLRWAWRGYPIPN